MTLFSSDKQIKAPCLFDWEQGIALHTMQGNRASPLSNRKFPVFSLVAAGTWGTFSSYGWDGHSKLVFVQRRQDSCLVRRDTSGI